MHVVGATVVPRICVARVPDVSTAVYTSRSQSTFFIALSFFLLRVLSKSPVFLALSAIDQDSGTYWALEAVPLAVSALGSTRREATAKTGYRRKLFQGGVCEQSEGHRASE